MLGVEPVSPETPQPPKTPERSGFGPIATAVFALIMVGSMIVLAVVLVGASGSGRNAIEAYISTVKAGATVSEAVAATEVDAVTRALRESGSFSISNFQSQQGTSCFWLKLARPGGELEARVVLAERASEVEVTAISLSRQCECPIDHNKPCRLR